MPIVRTRPCKQGCVAAQSALLLSTEGRQILDKTYSLPRSFTKIKYAWCSCGLSCCVRLSASLQALLTGSRNCKTLEIYINLLKEHHGNFDIVPICSLRQANSNVFEKLNILPYCLSPINHTACAHPAHLVRGAPLGDDDVAGLLDDGDAVRVEQLPVSLPALPELELEAALAVEDLRGIDRQSFALTQNMLKMYG